LYPSRGFIYWQNNRWHYLAGTSRIYTLKKIWYIITVNVFILVKYCKIWTIKIFLSTSYNNAVLNVECE